VVVKATKGKTVWVVAQLKKIFLNQNDVWKGFGEHNSLMFLTNFGWKHMN
jgi:hypothetical protein